MEPEDIEQGGPSPEMIWIEKEMVDQVIRDLETAADYLYSCMVEHDATLGRHTRKNRLWGEQIEADLTRIRATRRLFMSSAQEKRG